MSTSINMRNNKKSNIFLFLLAFIFFARNYYLPLQSFISHEMQLIMCVFFMGYYFISRKAKISIIILAYLFWIILASVIMIGTGNIRFVKNYIFEFINLTTPIFIYCIFKGYKETSRNRLQCAIIIFSVSVSILQIAGINNAVSAYYGRDEAGYILAYTNVILAVVSLYLVINGKSKFRRAFYFFAFLVYIISIIKMGFLIALATTIISCVFLIIPLKTKNIKYTIILVILIFITAVFLYVNYQLIMDLTIKLFDGTAYGERLNDIKSYFTNGSSADTLIARSEKYAISIKKILEHPILGGIWWSNDDIPILNIIGYHSFVLDMLALLGIPLGGLAIYLFFRPIGLKYKKSETGGKKFFITIIFSLFFILVFDNQIPSMGYATFYCAFWALDSLELKETSNNQWSTAWRKTAIHT